MMIGLMLLGLIEEPGVQRLGILRAQLENVAHFDGVPHGQLAAAPRAPIAVRRVPQVGELRCLESRPMLTPVRCVSASLAPVMPLTIPATSRSA